MGSRSLNFYIGVTGRLRFRVWQHKRGEIDGFTKKYKCDRLLYFEEWVYFDRAEHRETELKKWRREKKIGLIKTINPTFQDLAEHWYDDLPELQIPRRSAPRNDKSKSGEKPEMQLPRFARNDNSTRRNEPELQIPRRSTRDDNAKSGENLELQIPRRSAPRNDNAKCGETPGLQIPRRSAPRNDNVKSGNGLKKKSVARGKS